MEWFFFANCSVGQPLNLPSFWLWILVLSFNKPAEELVGSPPKIESVGVCKAERNSGDKRNTPSIYHVLGSTYFTVQSINRQGAGSRQSKCWPNGCQASKHTLACPHTHALAGCVQAVNASFVSVYISINRFSVTCWCVAVTMLLLLLLSLLQLVSSCVI